MPKPASPAVVRSSMTFTVLYLAIASVIAYRMENWEFFIYVFVVLTSALIILYLHHFLPISAAVCWMLSMWGFMHMLGGLIVLPDWMPVENERHVLYDLWLIPYVLKYDMLVHTLGFIGGTWGCWEVISPIIRTRRERFARVVIAVLMANGLGVINELNEFMAYLALPLTGVGGFVNTGFDLLCNLLGSLIGGAAAYVWGGEPPKRAA